MGNQDPDSTVQGTRYGPIDGPISESAQLLRGLRDTTLRECENGRQQPCPTSNLLPLDWPRVAACRSCRRGRLGML